MRRLPDGRWGEPRQRLDRGTQAYWSPDGRLLLFRSAAGAPSFELMPVDSGDPRPLYAGDGTSTKPAPEVASWSDDGRVFLLATSGVRRWTLLEVDPASGAWAPRVDFDPSVHAIFGRMIRVVKGMLYFLTEARESDVWVLEVTGR